MTLENNSQPDQREIERPFREIFTVNVDRYGNVLDPSAFGVDNRVGIKFSEIDRGRVHVRFTCDTQIRITRDKIPKRTIQTGQNEKPPKKIGNLVLSFSPSERVVFIGNQYRMVYLKRGTYARRAFMLESTLPINVTPVDDIRNYNLSVI